MPDYIVNPRIPSEIKLKREEKLLEVCFDDGNVFSFSAEFLRVHSPSAEVQGHSEDQRQVQDSIRRVATEKVAPRAAKIDREGVYPQDMFDLLRDLGLFTPVSYTHLPLPTILLV